LLQAALCFTRTYFLSTTIRQDEKYQGRVVIDNRPGAAGSLTRRASLNAAEKPSKEMGPLLIEPFALVQ